ncbi:Hypp3923 [Branchiostoma lanceolatum]|uniref:Hypp3923 protein n=1 Tax=Branchiostoma lanceolatum TaxID=7740 RepID=A0A8K0A3J2_BRALA|nr:Hypp3923 [Branchiostoma lanceolatum]
MSSFDVARASGRLLHIDARLEGSGLEDLASVQTDYARELHRAMAEADLLIEVEALKSLGDVFLEKGRIGGVLAEFGKAHSLYSVALARCTHIGEVQTLLHRVKYARSFIDKKSPPNEDNGRREPNGDVTQEQSSDLKVLTSDRLKIAETVQERLAGLTEESLPAGYVNLLVESVVASDVLAEVEALKGLGDAYLRRGGVSRDMADFTRASSLYSAGLARCQDADNRAAL